jgi:hypothetical protein
MNYLLSNTSCVLDCFIDSNCMKSICMGVLFLSYLFVFHAHTKSKNIIIPLNVCYERWKMV